MSFPKSVEARALAACGRCCCICHEFCGTHMELHHIHQRADGGEDSFENCIPLCLNCHADMGKGDPRHPKGKRYSEQELIMHRDRWYAVIKSGGSIGVEQTIKRYNEIRREVAEALTLYADRFHNPVDLANLPDHKLPEYYVEASRELRKLASKIIAISETLEDSYPISQQDMKTVEYNLIGLSNSMTTPYATGISSSELRNRSLMEEEIRTILSLSQR